MKYEYKRITTDHLLAKDELNAEGQARWELVNILILNGRVSKVIHTFKRVLTDDAIETTIDGKVVKVIVIDE